uniref:ER membrane protein complex subunit 2 n=1 Tax=Ciona savignyi TaxID=51511 RepID=H2YIZ8_CIOSA
NTMEMGWAEARDTLREWREISVRDSEQIAELGEFLVFDHSSKLKDELWLVCEQVYIAALDIGNYDLANVCIEKLNDQFPNSFRVRKPCQFEEALDAYKELESEDPTNAAIRKRKIVVLKSKGFYGDAIKCLVSYLQTFMADNDAWLELAELYIKHLDYEKAAFCMEELLISNPFNHLYHQRYAEIKYSQGHRDVARQYFAQSVKLSSNTNMRALYGLFLADGDERKKDNQYAAWTAKIISTKYRDVWSNRSEESGNSLKITPAADIPQLTAS